jgi:SAM-dependent methyltransferase
MNETVLAQKLDWYSHGDPLFVDGSSTLEINRHRFERALAVTKYSPDQSVLDIGSYPGTAMAFFNNYTAAGLLSEDYTNALKSIGVPTIPFNIENCGFSCEADLILFQEVIEHVRRPAAALKNIYDSMKPNSRIYITTNNIFYYGYIMKLVANRPILDDLLTELDIYPGHCRYYSHTELSQCLNDIGFTVLKSSNVNLLPPIRYYRNKKLGYIKAIIGKILPNIYSSHIEILAEKRE